MTISMTGYASMSPQASRAASSFQRYFDRIGNVSLICGAVDLAALPQDAIQISIETTHHNLINLSVAQGRAQTSRNALHMRGAAAAGFATDSLMAASSASAENRMECGKL